jgi:hypothetical protein
MKFATLLVWSLIIDSICFAQKENIVGHLYNDKGNLVYERIDSIEITDTKDVSTLLQSNLIKYGWVILQAADNIIIATLETDNNIKKYNVSPMSVCVQFGTKTKCQVAIKIKEHKYKIEISSFSFFNSALGWTSSDVFFKNDGALKSSSCISNGMQFLNRLIDEKTKIEFADDNW